MLDSEGQEGLGCVLAIFSLVLGICQLVVGLLGIDYHLGWWGIIGAVVLLLWLRFTIPITVGAYFGAVDVLGWPWWGGLLFAFPGIVFMVPSVMASLFDWRRERASRRELQSWLRDRERS